MKQFFWKIVLCVVPVAAAVTERLNEDLRARVLATRLLRRYGYLLPKLNPDSDLAAEHSAFRLRALYLELHGYTMFLALRRLMKK